jgi:NH3-dependent NAD+ synthetase
LNKATYKGRLFILLGALMPVYSMRNDQTQEEFDVNMKYSELEEYLKDHPEITQIFTKFPGYVDPVNIGVRKIDNSFRDVLHKAKSAHKRSTIEY